MAKKINFEEAIGRLEDIVNHLEQGEVPLEESIKLYEEGMRLGKMCRRILNEADQRVRQLTTEIEKESGSE